MCASPVDTARVNVHQLTPSDRGILERLAEAGTRSAADAMSRLLSRTVTVGHARVDFLRIADMSSLLQTLPHHMTVVYIESTGHIAGQLVLIAPASSATTVVNMLLGEAGIPGIDRAAARRDAMGEIGNIVLSAYLNGLVDQTMLDADPSPPMVALDSSGAVLELPLTRAASDLDAVVRFDATFAIGEGESSASLRTPFHILFLPAPGTLGRMLDVLDDNQPRSEMNIPVRMGELAVSRRAGDMLVASGIGSCIAVAVTDRLARVAALAHVMLPKAPDNWASSGRPTYAARYADTAIPAMIAALERAGGRRICCRAYIAGGGQMFSGSMAALIDIPDRNILAIRTALDLAGVPIHGDETGGSSSRSLQVAVRDLSVRVAVDGMKHVQLDAA